MGTQTNGNSKTRILFVDDSKLMRLSARKVLSEEFEVVLAENAEQARQLLQLDSSIQILFTDLNMPEESGYQLLASLRASNEPRLCSLPIIIVTCAENQETERRNALRAGATDFINKPFKASELLARARTLATFNAAQARLDALSTSHPIDLATGLGNRNYCLDRLAQAISFARRHSQPLSLVHLRLDGLTRLLDDLGEPHSGQAMQRLGTLLNQSIRQEDTVYRIGPEAFCFLLPATPKTGAMTLRDRFIPDLEALGFAAQGNPLKVAYRFAIDQVDLDSSLDPEAIVDAVKVETMHTVRPRSQTDRTIPPGIEQALAMAQRGEVHALVPHLSTLHQQLRPLLALIDGLAGNRSVEQACS